MTVKQAIAKHNLIQKTKDFEGKPINYPCYTNRIETPDKITTICLDKLPELDKFYLTVQTFEKNNIVRYAKTDSYRHKTTTNVYELDE
jgi:hypothetical protein